MTHENSSGLRPRQRTFTSCTECRRRKQRVCLYPNTITVSSLTRNSAIKPRTDHAITARDATRLCFAHMSVLGSTAFTLCKSRTSTNYTSSPTPSFDQVVDFRDSSSAGEGYVQPSNRDRDIYSGSSSYVQPSSSQNYQSDMNNVPATSGSESNYNSNLDSNSRAYYSSSPSYASHTSTSFRNNDYGSSYTNDKYIPATTSYSSDGTYYSSGQATYTSPAATHGGYYSTSQGGGDWLSSGGDPNAYVGATSGEYYYPHEEEDEMGSRR